MEKFTYCKEKNNGFHGDNNDNDDKSESDVGSGYDDNKTTTTRNFLIAVVIRKRVLTYFYI